MAKQSEPRRWTRLDGAKAFDTISASDEAPGPLMEAWFEARSQALVREAFNRGVRAASHLRATPVPAVQRHNKANA